MIGDWLTDDIAKAVDGTAEGDNVAFTRVTTDSRGDCSGALFVALKGDRFDGHEYIDAAVSKGAVAVLAQRKVAADAAQIIVPDSLVGLGRLGALNRSRFDGPVAAVTGSAGKTTVKELLASILSQRGEVCKTQGNFNNHIGAPLSLLQLTDAHKSAVFELGASAVGEIAYTVALARPQVAILNNAAAVHIEGFGDLASIVKAKGEIVCGLPEDGVAVLNKDDANFSAWVEMAGARKVISFGMDESAMVRAQDVNLELNGSTFQLCAPEGDIDATLPLPGAHNVRNALAAAAAALALGWTLNEVRDGLASAVPVKGRMNKLLGINGSVILDDTYNASPTSVKAAIDVLARYPGRRIVALGHMGELGSVAEEAHREVAQYARDNGVDMLLGIGRWAAEYREGFGDASPVVTTHDDIAAWLRERLDSNTTVLVKGSRSAAMENVVKQIVEK
ncbi:UDP-N-acetylmuramoyl-tripeptide--D-alanyl-D-alanine ligase [Hahella sp. HN01]|nr:UDP-N-acetylmuramoyl-tripeptide--D-alanyl-D-alanine ligase [Hahella sp. HN01]